MVSRCFRYWGGLTSTPISINNKEFFMIDVGIIKYYHETLNNFLSFNLKRKKRLLKVCNNPCRWLYLERKDRIKPLSYREYPYFFQKISKIVNDNKNVIIDSFVKQKGL